MNIALIIAGGTGTRMGSSIPKQYIEVASQPIINYSLNVFASVREINKIVIVAASEYHNLILKNYNKQVEISFAAPGRFRQESILNGLKVISSLIDFNRLKTKNYVLIHDAARPNIDIDLIYRILNSVREHDAVMPVVKVKDTLYVSNDGEKVSKILNRNSLFVGQTPEAFDFEKYYLINKNLSSNELESISGSSQIAFMSSMDVYLIPGDENNYKITTQKDLQMFESYIAKLRNNK